jgi:hypothetical protein
LEPTTIASQSNLQIPVGILCLSIYIHTMSCSKRMTFEEKELAILREAVDRAEAKAGRKITHAEETKKMIDIVENFLRRKKLVCYGGTAINNILPEQDQFYNKDVEIPDYDFFSADALNDAKRLADIYAEQGYTEVEAKAGVHVGTYKVFVNFIPMADITSIPKELFKALQREAVQRAGILYAPPDYLRMAMYLELSRPDGDVSRWEKVLKRLTLLNKNYPMKNPRCDHVDFIRSFEGSEDDAKEIYTIVRDSITDQGLVFFGGYASRLYSRYMKGKEKAKVKNMSPDFDALAEDPEMAALIIKERLMDSGFHGVHVYKHKGFGEIIAPHYEISIGKDTVAFIYKPLACHSYNVIRLGGKKVKVATIDTMLSFYLAFLFADRPYYDHERLICMSQYLFSVQARNRLEQKGVLRRFSISCYGKQETLEEMRAEKTKLYEELYKKRGSKKWDEVFLKYNPNEDNKKKKGKKKTKSKAKRKQKKTKKRNLFGL